MNRIKLLKNYFKPRSLTRNNSSTQNNHTQSIPDLMELEKLKPTRLTKYLPSIHPNYYIHQIKTTSNQLNRAFSKNQLVQICQSIQNQQNLTNSFQKSSSKQSLISFILFNHWNLTHPDQIKANQSFHELVINFKSDHESQNLPHHELFLIHLDHQLQSPNKISLIDKITRNLNLKIQFDIDHLHQPQLTIFGRLRDRQKFWNEFQKKRKPIFKFNIHLPHPIDLGFQFNQSLLKSLSECCGCYLELLNPCSNEQQSLVAYSFDENYPVDKVLKEVERYSILSNEYGNSPILIDLNQFSRNSIPLLPSSTSAGQGEISQSTSASAHDTLNKPLAFLPFSYPFRLDWPLNSLNLDNNNLKLSRLVSPTKIQNKIHSIPSKFEVNHVLNHHHQDDHDQHLLFLEKFIDLVPSKSLYLLNRSGCASVDLQEWISNSFSIDDERNERIESTIYDGHYLKSTETSSDSSINDKMIQNPFQSGGGFIWNPDLDRDRDSGLDPNSNEKMIKYLQYIWKSQFDLETCKTHRHQTFRFLHKSNHPISLKLNCKLNSKKEYSKSEENQEVKLESHYDASSIKQSNEEREDVEGIKEIKAEESQEDEESIVEVYYPSSFNQKDPNLDFLQSQIDVRREKPKISFEVTKRKRNNNDGHKWNNYAHHGAHGDGDDGYEIEKIEKVWKKQLIILRPHQATDIMIQVSKRKDITSEVLKKPQTTVPDVKKMSVNHEDKKETDSSTKHDLGKAVDGLNDKPLISYQNRDQVESINKSEGEKHDQTHDLISEHSIHSNLDQFLNGLLLINKFNTRQVLNEKISTNKVLSMCNSLGKEREQKHFLSNGNFFKVIECRSVYLNDQQNKPLQDHHDDHGDQTHQPFYSYLTFFPKLE